MEIRLLEEGEMVEKGDQIRWRPEGSYDKKWSKVPKLLVGKPKPILCNPIKRVTCSK